MSFPLDDPLKVLLCSACNGQRESLGSCVEGHTHIAGAGSSSLKSYCFHFERASGNG